MHVRLGTQVIWFSLTYDCILISHFSDRFSLMYAGTGNVCPALCNVGVTMHPQLHDGIGQDLGTVRLVD